MNGSYLLMAALCLYPAGIDLFSGHGFASADSFGKD
jgi:hypothetical protein